MLRMPSGSKRSRMSDLMRTPKEARMPRVSGCLALRDLTVSRSSLALAWKRRLTEGRNTSSVKSARGPLPKKMTLGCIVAPKFVVVFNLGVIIDGVELALVVHFEEGVFDAFDVVDKENAVEVVDFVEEGAGEGAFSLDADGSAVL